MPKFTNLQSQSSSADRELRSFFPELRIRKKSETFDLFHNQRLFR